jgi:hemin uptake protein HemP
MRIVRIYQKSNVSMSSSAPATPKAAHSRHSSPGAVPVKRIKSQDLFECMRELEIEHEGRIYRLRMTQLNKLILTA